MDGTAVPAGFAIGHWTDAEAQTGCTVILPPAGSRCGLEVRGGGPGTRETEIVGPLANPQEATAVLLTGGSAHGLAAADGVMRWCEEQGRGYRTPGGLVPLVPAAVIYDLLAGDPSVRPGPEQGRAACEAAR
jgi:L-aminopeptidase/D-esterase-like protein